MNHNEGADAPKKKKKKRVGTHFLDFRYLPYDFGRVTGWPVAMVWHRPKWLYVSKDAKKRVRGGCLLMVNHVSFTDPIMAMLAVWYRRQHFLATKELFDGPVKNILFHLFHCIRVDRENFSLGTFREITDHLKAGNVVTVYPEGHINFSEGEVAAFKSGLVMMALRSGVPIVPVYMKSPGKFPGRAYFVIGEPIDLRAKYGPLPPVEVVAGIAEELHGEELKLKEYLDSYIEHKKK